MSNHVKINNQQREIDGIWAKVDNKWREVIEEYGKVEDEWRETWINNFPAPTFLTYPDKIVRGSSISWSTSNISGANYEVQVSYNGGAFGSSKFFTASSGTWNITTDINMSSIQFRVRAVAPTTYDKPSPWFTGLKKGLVAQSLNEPTGLIYPTSITRGQKIRVSWTNISSSIIYELQAVYERSDGTASPIQVFRGAGKNYVDYVVQTNTSWKQIYFRIRAIQTGYYTSDYAYGPERTLQKITLDTVPTLSTPTPTYGQRITVSWGAVSNAQQYILGCQYDDGPWLAIYGGANRAYTYTVSENKQYKTLKWRVKAVASEYNDSAWKTSADQSITKPPLKVTTWTPTQTGSWRSREDWGWREDNDRVYQGSWNEPPWWGNHIGCVWFNYNSIRNTLAGKDIERVRIYFYRMNTSHGYASGQAIKLHTISLASKPTNDKVRPTLSYVQGPFSSFNRGEGKWITVSNKVAERIRDGSATGIALYREDEQGYLYMSPNIILEVTYR